MKVNLRRLKGNWKDGFALDKHIVKSTFLGYNEQGYAQFDTQRTEAGESVFRLKYRADWSQAKALAEAINEHVVPKFPDIGLVIPMPASNIRARQPVDEIAKELAKLMNLSVFSNIVVKSAAKGKALKDLTTKDEKLNALKDRFSISDGIDDAGPWNALLIDDLFDSGASMEAVTAALKTYNKISNVYVAAITWK